MEKLKLLINWQLAAHPNHFLIQSLNRCIQSLNKIETVLYKKGKLNDTKDDRCLLLLWLLLLLLTCELLCPESSASYLTILLPGLGREIIRRHVASNAWSITWTVVHIHVFVIYLFSSFVYSFFISLAYYLLLSFFLSRHRLGLWSKFNIWCHYFIFEQT